MSNLESQVSFVAIGGRRINNPPQVTDRVTNLPHKNPNYLAEKR